MAHANDHWSDVLPTVLLGLHCTVREDVGVSPAEMLYGTTLRLPGEFFESPSLDTSSGSIPLSFVNQLKQKMELLRPIPDSNHSTTKIFDMFLFEKIQLRSLYNLLMLALFVLLNVSTNTLLFWLKIRKPTFLKIGLNLHFCYLLIIFCMIIVIVKLNPLEVLILLLLIKLRNKLVLVVT